MDKTSPTSFRLDAESLRILDEIAADLSRKRGGEPVTRTQALRALLREQGKKTRTR